MQAVCQFYTKCINTCLCSSSEYCTLCWALLARYSWHRLLCVRPSVCPAAMYSILHLPSPL